MNLKPWCTCGSQQAWTNIGDGWWVHPNCGKPTRMFWEKKMDIPSERTFWSPPPPGLSKTMARIGPDVYESFTYRCPADSECMALAYSKNSDAAKRAIDGHICPAPPRRDMVPSGKTVIQKLWDELDGLIDQVKVSKSRPFDADLDALMGASRGIALALALLSTPWFRSTEDILRQANKRWRMHQKEIPWEMTPGYNYYPAAPLAFATAPEPVVKKRQPVSKVAKKAAPLTPPSREFSVDERAVIRSAVHNGLMSIAVLAKTYGVTEERIATIAGPKVDASAPSLPGIVLF